MKNDFTEGSVERCILLQAVPLTLAQLIQLLYSIVDRIYIGHLPGAEGYALTGVGLVFPLVSLLSAFTNLFSSGGAPLCAIALGAGDRRRAEALLGNTTLLLLGSSVLLMGLIGLFQTPLLYLSGASEHSLPYARDYLSIYLWGTAFSLLGTGLNPFINLQGYPRIGMYTVLLGALSNLILDPILIFGLGLGVSGAAIATVVSQFLSFVWVLSFLRRPGLSLRLRAPILRLSLPLTKEICALGLSGFIMSSTNSLVSYCCNLTLKFWGGELYVGIMTIINALRDMISLPPGGVSSGAQPVLGYNYGAARYERVQRGIRFMSLLGLGLAGASWLLIMLFPEALMRIFTRLPDMLRLGRPAVRLYFSCIVFMALQFSAQSTFVALGKARRAIFFSLLRKVIIVVPLTLLLPRLFGLGVYGVFLAEPISNVIGGSAAYLTMLASIYRPLGRAAQPGPT